MRASVLLLLAVAASSQAASDFGDPVSFGAFGDEATTFLPQGTFEYEVVEGGWTPRVEYSTGSANYPFGWSNEFSVKGASFHAGRLGSTGYPNQSSALAGKAPQSFTTYAAGDASFYVEDAPYHDNEGYLTVALREAILRGDSRVPGKFYVGPWIGAPRSLPPATVTLESGTLFAQEFGLRSGTVNIHSGASFSTNQIWSDISGPVHLKIDGGELRVEPIPSSNVHIKGQPGQVTMEVKQGGVLATLDSSSGAKYWNLEGVDSVLSTGARVSMGKDWTFIVSSGSLRATETDFRTPTLNVGSGPGSASLELGKGAVATLDGSFNRLWINGSPGTIAKARLTDGAIMDAAADPLTCQASQCNTYIGNTAGYSGHLIVENGSSASFLNRLTVGGAHIDSIFGVTGGTGNGWLTIKSRSTLRSGNTEIGGGPFEDARREKGKGVAVVEDSSWTISGTSDRPALAIGSRVGGDGSLSVVRGGVEIIASSGSPLLAVGIDGGRGAASIIGENSSVTFQGPDSASVVVGYRQNSVGSLKVAGGASIGAGSSNGLAFMSVGGDSGEGYLELDGAGTTGQPSSIHLSGRDPGDVRGARLSIGGGGQGEAWVKSGAQLSVSAVNVPTAIPGIGIGIAGGRGKLIVNGASSLVELVGAANATLRVGDGISSIGAVTVNGSKLRIESFVSGDRDAMVRPAIELGSNGGYGTLLADASSTVELHGRGSFISVQNGEATFLGNLKSRIADPTQQPSFIASSGKVTLTGSWALEIEGRGNKPGYIQLAQAESINLGDRAALAITGTSRLLGSAKFDVTTTDGLYYSPERLYGDCLLTCQSSLGIRGITPATGGGAPVAIGVISTLSDARNLVQGLVRSAYFAADASYSKDGALLGYQTLGEVDLYGLRAAAYQRASGGEVIVGIRGTEVPQNVASYPGLALGEKYPLFGAYVNNLSSLVSTVYSSAGAAPPSIYLTGHSLGGALSAIVANALGVPSIGFNAPGVSGLDAFSDTTVALSGFARPLPSSELLNIRLTSDPVSKTPLERYGQTITLLGDPISYLVASVDRLGAMRPMIPNFDVILAVAKSFGAAGHLFIDHRLENIGRALADPGNYPIAMVEGSTTIDNSAEAILAAARLALSNIFGVDNKLLSGVTFQGSFAQGVLYAFDPLPAAGYEFSIVGGANAFEGVLLPYIDENSGTYSVQTFDAGRWGEETAGVSGDFISFEEASSKFRVRLQTAPSTDVLDALYFGVTFALEGDFAAKLQAIDVNGNPISAIPEPETFALMLFGIVVLVVAQRYRTSRTRTGAETC